MSRQLIGGAMLLAMIPFAACGSDDPAATSDGEETPAEEPFYQDEVIELVVTTGPGGGVDAQVQQLIPFLQRHIEGNPELTVTYVEGAGGVLGGNEYALTYEPDGLSVMFASRSTSVAWAMGEPEVRYDLTDMNLIAAFPNSAVVIARGDSGVSSVTDLLDPPSELYLGGQTPGGSNAISPLALEALGVRENVNLVWGYGGTGDRIVALESGELNLEFQTDELWLREGERLGNEHDIQPIVHVGYPDGEGGMENPVVDGVPTIGEAYEMIYDEQPSGMEWDAYLMVGGITSAGTIAMMHSDAPAEAVDAFRAGVIAAVEDPEYQALEGASVAPLVGDELQAVEQLFFDLDTDLAEWVNDWLREHFPDEME